MVGKRHRATRSDIRGLWGCGRLGRRLGRSGESFPGSPLPKNCPADNQADERKRVSNSPVLCLAEAHLDLLSARGQREDDLCGPLRELWSERVAVHFEAPGGVIEQADRQPYRPG